jgi:hypothetical protein
MSQNLPATRTTRSSAVLQQQQRTPQPPTITIPQSQFDSVSATQPLTPTNNNSNPNIKLPNPTFLPPHHPLLKKNDPTHSLIASEFGMVSVDFTIIDDNNVNAIDKQQVKPKPRPARYLRCLYNYPPLLATILNLTHQIRPHFSPNSHSISSLFDENTPQILFKSDDFSQTRQLGINSAYFNTYWGHIKDKNNNLQWFSNELDQNEPILFNIDQYWNAGCTRGSGSDIDGVGDGNNHNGVKLGEMGIVSDYIIDDDDEKPITKIIQFFEPNETLLKEIEKILNLGPNKLRGVNEQNNVQNDQPNQTTTSKRSQNASPTTNTLDNQHKRIRDRNYATNIVHDYDDGDGDDDGDGNNSPNFNFYYYPDFSNLNMNNNTEIKIPVFNSKDFPQHTLLNPSHTNQTPPLSFSLSLTDTQFSALLNTLSQQQNNFPKNDRFIYIFPQETPIDNYSSGDSDNIDTLISSSSEENITNDVQIQPIVDHYLITIPSIQFQSLLRTTLYKLDTYVEPLYTQFLPKSNFLINFNHLNAIRHFAGDCLFTPSATNPSPSPYDFLVNMSKFKPYVWALKKYMLISGINFDANEIEAFFDKTFHCTLCSRLFIEPEEVQSHVKSHHRWFLDAHEDIQKGNNDQVRFDREEIKKEIAKMEEIKAAKKVEPKSGQKLEPNLAYLEALFSNTQYFSCNYCLMTYESISELVEHTEDVQCPYNSRFCGSFSHFCGLNNGDLPHNEQKQQKGDSEEKDSEEKDSTTNNTSLSLPAPLQPLPALLPRSTPMASPNHDQNECVLYTNQSYKMWRKINKNEQISSQNPQNLPNFQKFKLDSLISPPNSPYLEYRPGPKSRFNANHEEVYLGYVLDKINKKAEEKTLNRNLEPNLITTKNSSQTSFGKNLSSPNLKQDFDPNYTEVIVDEEPIALEKLPPTPITYLPDIAHLTENEIFYTLDNSSDEYSSDDDDNGEEIAAFLDGFAIFEKKNKKMQTKLSKPPKPVTPLDVISHTTLKRLSKIKVDEKKMEIDMIDDESDVDGSQMTLLDKNAKNDGKNDAKNEDDDKTSISLNKFPQARIQQYLYDVRDYYDDFSADFDVPTKSKPSPRDVLIEELSEASQETPKPTTKGSISRNTSKNKLKNQTSSPQAQSNTLPTFIMTTPDHGVPQKLMTIHSNSRNLLRNSLQSDLNYLDRQTRERFRLTRLLGGMLQPQQDQTNQFGRLFQSYTTKNQLWTLYAFEYAPDVDPTASNRHSRSFPSDSQPPGFVAGISRRSNSSTTAVFDDDDGGDGSTFAPDASRDSRRANRVFRKDAMHDIGGKIWLECWDRRDLAWVDLWGRVDALANGPQQNLVKDGAESNVPIKSKNGESPSIETTTTTATTDNSMTDVSEQALTTPISSQTPPTVDSTASTTTATATTTTPTVTTTTTTTTTAPSTTTSTTAESSNLFLSYYTTPEGLPLALMEDEPNTTPFHTSEQLSNFLHLQYPLISSLNPLVLHSPIRSRYNACTVKPQERELFFAIWNMVQPNPRIDFFDFTNLTQDAFMSMIIRARDRRTVQLLTGSVLSHETGGKLLQAIMTTTEIDVNYCFLCDQTFETPTHHAAAHYRYYQLDELHKFKCQSCLVVSSKSAAITQHFTKRRGCHFNRLVHQAWSAGGWRHLSKELVASYLPDRVDNAIKNRSLDPEADAISLKKQSLQALSLDEFSNDGYGDADFSLADIVPIPGDLSTIVEEDDQPVSITKSPSSLQEIGNDNDNDNNNNNMNNNNSNNNSNAMNDDGNDLSKTTQNGLGESSSSMIDDISPPYLQTDQIQRSLYQDSYSAVYTNSLLKRVSGKDLHVRVWNDIDSNLQVTGHLKLLVEEMLDFVHQEFPQLEYCDFLSSNGFELPHDFDPKIVWDNCITLLPDEINQASEYIPGKSGMVCNENDKSSRSTRQTRNGTMLPDPIEQYIAPDLLPQRPYQEAKMYRKSPSDNIMALKFPDDQPPPRVNSVPIFKTITASKIPLTGSHFPNPHSLSSFLVNKYPTLFDIGTVILYSPLRWHEHGFIPLFERRLFIIFLRIVLHQWKTNYFDFLNCDASFLSPFIIRARDRRLVELLIGTCISNESFRRIFIALGVLDYEGNTIETPKPSNVGYCFLCDSLCETTSSHTTVHQRYFSTLQPYARCHACLYAAVNSDWLAQHMLNSKQCPYHHLALAALQRGWDNIPKRIINAYKPTNVSRALVIGPKLNMYGAELPWSAYDDDLGIDDVSDDDTGDYGRDPPIPIEDPAMVSKRPQTGSERRTRSGISTGGPAVDAAASGVPGFQPPSRQDKQKKPHPRNLETGQPLLFQPTPFSLVKTLRGNLLTKYDRWWSSEMNDTTPLQIEHAYTAAKAARDLFFTANVGLSGKYTNTGGPSGFQWNFSRK